VAANADFIISNDKGFDILKNVEFPPIAVLKYDQFEHAYKATLT